MIDSQIHANSGDLDIKGDLNVITTPDIWEGSGSSWNANVGTNGFGGGVGEITEDKNWTDTASGMWFEEGADIDVEGKTYLEGGAIVSEQEGGLSLSTGELEVADLAINDYADDTYVGGQVNVNVGNVVTGKGDAFTENKYGTVEYESEGHEKEGSVNSTLSGLGELTIGGETQDLATLEDMGINTDADNIITITKDESWEESFKVDLINVGVVAEQVDNLVNVVESFTAKVPDHVKADGKAGEDLYRKAIANGLSDAELDAFIGSDRYNASITVMNAYEDAIDEYGAGNIPEEYTEKILGDLNNLLFNPEALYQSNCASAGLSLEVCNQLMQGALDGEASFELIQAALIDYLNGAYDDDTEYKTTFENSIGAYLDCLAQLSVQGTKEGNQADQDIMKTLDQALDKAGYSFTELSVKAGVTQVPATSVDMDSLEGMYYGGKDQALDALEFAEVIGTVALENTAGLLTGSERETTKEIWSQSKELAGMIYDDPSLLKDIADELGYEISTSNYDLAVASGNEDASQFYDGYNASHIGLGALTAIVGTKGLDKVIKAAKWVKLKGTLDVTDYSQIRKYWNDPIEVSGTKVYQRDDIFDINAVDDRGRTNMQRMEKGLAPIGHDGKSINLHHMNQRNDGAIAELTQTFHQGNYGAIHINSGSKIPSGIDRPTFEKWKRNYWKNRVNDFK